MLSGSLYYYFNSKESIVEEVLADYLDQMITGYREAIATQSSALAGLEGCVTTALRALTTHRAEVRILQNDWHYVRPLEGIEARDSEVEAIWLAAIKDAVASGEIRSDVDPRMIFRTLMGAVMAVARWFEPGGKVTIDEVVRVQLELLLDGVRNTPKE
jgi:AcrR family transcriptional regulator